TTNTLIGHLDFLTYSSWMKEVKFAQVNLAVERTIQTKYSHYQRDTEFLQTRQRHADLRAKLDVLKKRIHAWEKNHAKMEAATKNELEA
uniref:OCEL domain-containing protein n=1 Tax=Ascaris lumbricoides TaxID=6252 RepID=A0A0M3HF57_ASCLU